MINEPDDDDDDDPRPLLLVIVEHRTRSDAIAEVVIWPDQALIQWLGQTENTRDHDGDDPGEWPTYAAEVVADILAGYRLVENTYWRRRGRRTRWHDVRGPANRERLSTEVGPAFWWLFVTLPGAQVEHERVDFGAEARH